MELFNSIGSQSVQQIVNLFSGMIGPTQDAHLTSTGTFQVPATEFATTFQIWSCKSRAKLLTSDPMTFQHWVNPRPIVLRSEQALVCGFCCKQRVSGTALDWKTCETIKIVQPIPKFQSWFIICQLVANQLAKFSCSALFSVKHCGFCGTNIKFRIHQIQSHIHHRILCPPLPCQSMWNL